MLAANRLLQLPLTSNRNAIGKTMKLRIIIIFTIVFVAYPWESIADEIAGLGRIMPASGVVSLVTPAGEIFNRIEVREGDGVKKDQILAYFKSFESRSFDLKFAKIDLEKINVDYELDVRLKQTKISGFKEQIEFLNKQINRFHESNALQYTTPEIVEKRQKEVLQLQNNIAVTRVELEKVEKQFPLTQQLTMEKIREAEIALDNGLIRSPIDATVLKVLAYPGYAAGGSEAFKLGNVDTLYALTEVYESDARHLKIGQKATITSIAFPGNVNGTVKSITPMIFKSTVESIDPTVDTDPRAVETWIQLENNDILRKLIYLQVDVSIITN